MLYMRDSESIAEKRSREDIISDIELLLATKGYIFAFAEAISKDFFVDVQNVANIDWRARLHSHEVAFLMGLMLKNEAVSFNEINKEQIDEAIKYTRLLLDELHSTYMYNFDEAIMKHSSEQIKAMSDEEKEKEFREIFGSKEMIIETTFYGDTGFYDIQSFEIAQRLYAQDKDWI